MLSLLATILGILTILLSSMKSTSYVSDSPVFFPTFPPIGGQEVSFTQAQASVPFKINMPSTLGNFVQLKLEKENLMIIYAPSKPSPDANIFDIIGQNGIALLETPNTMTSQLSDQNIKDAINATKNDVGGGLQPVNINGHLGCAGGNVEHTVTWYTQTTRYELIASTNYPLQQLIETANSISIN
jgi:hypothetical protein